MRRTPGTAAAAVAEGAGWPRVRVHNDTRKAHMRACTHTHTHTHTHNCLLKYLRDRHGGAYLDVPVARACTDLGLALSVCCELLHSAR